MKAHSLPSLLVLGLLVVAPTLSVRSAPEDETVQLEQLDVTARRTGALTAPSFLDARAELSLTPGGVEAIDAKRFLRGRASTLEDTFALSAGVVAQSRFGSDEARLSIRGSGLQRTFHGRGLRVLQDGVPINLADGSFDMQAIEPLATDYVKVWRGANAMVHGASTLGGAIEYVSRTGRTAPGAFSRVEFGSWEYLRGTVAGGAVRGESDAFISFTQHQQTSFRDHAKQDNQRLFANAGHRFSQEVETRFSLAAIRTESELPGNLTRAQLHADPRQAAAGNVALDQKRDFDLIRISNTTAVRMGDTRWEMTAAWTYKDLDHPIFQVIDQLSRDLLIRAVVTHAGEFVGRSLRFRGGVLFNRGETDAVNFVNAGGRRGARVAAAKQIASNTEAFAEGQLALSRGWTVVLATAGAINGRRSDQTLGATPDYDVRYRQVVPKVGVRWDSPQVQVYANGSASYEPPSFSEALTLNTARSAQTGWTWELGTRGTHGAVRWDVSVYSATLEKELLALDHDNLPATPAATVNADDTLHQGVELAIEADLLGQSMDAAEVPGHRFVFRAAWTYGRFRFRDDPLYGDNVLAGLPQHLIRGELMWEHVSGWYAGPTFEVVPEKTYIDFRNTTAADAYAIGGFRVGRRVERGISWFAEAKNVSDKVYTATTGVIENAGGRDQAQFLPGDGRGLFVGLEYGW